VNLQGRNDHVVQWQEILKSVSQLRP